VIIMMVREDILRQVLESRGLDVEEVLAEAQRRQDIVGLLTEVGKRVAKIVGEFGLVDIEVKVEDGKVTVWWDDGTLTETASLALTQNDDDAKDAKEGKGRKDARGPQIVAKLEAAVKRFGLELKGMAEKINCLPLPSNCQEPHQGDQQWHPV
jgi:Ethanolamine utilization protein EutJ (predicted chaperonin)